MVRPRRSTLSPIRSSDTASGRAPTARESGGTRRAAAAGPVPPVLVRQIRNGIVESEHRGHIVEVDVAGSIVRSLGDPDRVVTLRSAVKPFGLIGLIEAGAVEDDLARAQFGKDYAALPADQQAGIRDAMRAQLQHVFWRRDLVQAVEHLRLVCLARPTRMAGNLRRNSTRDPRECEPPHCAGDETTE